MVMRDLRKLEVFRMKNKIRIACATDDGNNLIREHFGDARFFMIYEMDMGTGSYIFIENIDNSSPEERKHGDPAKAKSISEILDGPQVLLAITMGTNIVRMRKRFCPVISRERDIEKALDLLSKKIDLISVEVEKKEGMDREIIQI